MAVEWVQVGAGRVLVATEESARVIGATAGALGLGRPMPDGLAGALSTTRRLLDGAIAAAAGAASPSEEPSRSALRWAWQLIGQWACAHHSVALLPPLIKRFEAAGRFDLAVFASGKLIEETGHDQFALTDLRALGYDAELLVRSVPPPPPVAAALRYAQTCADGQHPVEFLGYMYALERLVLTLPPTFFEELAVVLPDGVDASSGLRAHATELDEGHVDEAVRFIAGLPGNDRSRIAIACYRTIEVCCQPFRHPTDAELEAWLPGSQRTLAGHGAARRPEPTGDEP